MKLQDTLRIQTQNFGLPRPSSLRVNEVGVPLTAQGSWSSRENSGSLSEWQVLQRAKQRAR